MPPVQGDLTLARLQRLIAEQFLERDQKRGLAMNFTWLAEELGEVARAIRRDERSALEEELADVIAWTASIANVAGIDLAAAVESKYGAGCPRCRGTPCLCPERREFADGATGPLR